MVPVVSVDLFRDRLSRLDLVRFRGRGRFGGWLVLVWEPRDSAVSGWVRIVAACQTTCFRGLVRESDPEIGFGTRGTLEPVRARLRNRPVIINEP